MKQNSCYLCRGKSLTQIADRVRDRDDISVLKCDNCGLVFMIYTSKNLPSLEE